MSVKSSRSVLQLSASAFREAAKCSRPQQRSFTKSAQRLRYGPVAKFTNLSSPELENALNTIREKRIMPSHLTALQRNLIYKEKNRKALLLDPVVVNLDGEEFTLVPIDRTKDLPNLRRSLWDVLALMKTKEDWDNLPLLLKGLRQCGLVVNATAFDIILRTAGKAGRQDVIFECIRRADITGFYLHKPEFVRQVIWWFQKKAADSDFDPEVTKKTLAWSESLFEMMESEPHAPKNTPEGHVDPRADPLVVGLVLELAAVRAFKHRGAQDADGKVKEYVDRFLATSPDLGRVEGKSPRMWISRTIPILLGMKSALKILHSGTETTKALQNVTAPLETEIIRVRKELEAQRKDESGPAPFGFYDKVLTELA